MASDSEHNRGDDQGETSYGFQPSEDTYDTPGGYEDEAPSSNGAAGSVNFNPASRSQSARQLKNKEEDGGRHGAAGLAAGGLSGLASRESRSREKKTNNDGSFSYVNNGAKWGKARGFMQKHKKKLVAGSLAGIGILPILALILFLMAALKIPHFVENVAAWRFAKLTRQYRTSVNNVMGEKNALDSLTDEEYKAASQRYGKYRIFDGINRLRPNRVLQSMEAADRIQYNYKTTITGRQKLVSITIAPDQDFRSKTTIKVPTGKFDKLIHPFQTLDKYKSIADALDAAMKAHDPKIPILTRTLATKQVLEAAGASLKGMVASKYLGKDTQGAELQKIYNDLVANAGKYNELIKQYNALVEQYNGLYAQHQQTYPDWQALYKEWQGARDSWQTAYTQLQQTTGSPSEELLQNVADAAEKYDLLNSDFLAKSAELKDLLISLKSTRDQMGAIKTQLETLRDERVKLTQDFSSNGGTLSDRDAKIAIEEETFDVAHRNGGINGLISDNEKQVAQQADEAQTAARNDPNTIGQMVDSGADVPDTVNNAVQSALNPDNLANIAKTVVGWLNPLYDIAVPVCMAYEGSRITSQQIDAQHDSKVSEAAYVISTNDELKDGRSMNSVMTNAMNWKLGDIQNSNAMNRVNGKPVNTLNETGMGQRTPLGTYGEFTIFDVIHLHMLNGAADSMCPKLTNFWVGLGIGIGNLALMAIGSFFTGGGAAAGEVTATKAAEEAADEALTTIVKRMIVTATKKTIKGFASSGRFAKQFAKDTIKYGAATAAATFLASMIVQNAAGTFSSGFEHSVSFDDNVDDGTEQLAGDMGRANNYARPLNNTEIANSQSSDRQEAIYYNQHLSTYDRYFALSNPNSLMSRSILTTGSLLNKSIFASLLNSLASVFNPVGLTSHLFATANAQTTFAAGNADTQDYGNIVWGYSNEEITLMSNDPSYSSPSENSRVLDASGKSDEIDQKYSACYSATIGSLLETKKIQRQESDGDVTNSGDCSPEQLGPNNPQYGDLVFRWRLEHNYQNTSDTLSGIADPSSSTTLGSAGNIPSGTAQQLAQQIIQNGNISFSSLANKNAMTYIGQTGHANDCNSPNVSPALLGIILAAGAKYKIVLGSLVDGHPCDNTLHPKGMAADITAVGPINSTAKQISNLDFKDTSNPLLQFYGDMGNFLAQSGGGSLGEYQCFAPPPTKNTKVLYDGTTMDTACDHIYVGVGH